jgi:hypothetical protein
MSLSKPIGRLVGVALVVYLFMKGALVLRPRETTAALSALIAALLHACCGAGSASPDGRAALEERGQRDFVGVGQSHQAGEGDVGLAALDDAQVLRVDAGSFGCLLLGQPLGVADLTKPQAQPLPSPVDGPLDRGLAPDLRRSVGPIRR